MDTSGHSIYIFICPFHQAFFTLALGEDRHSIRSSGPFLITLSIVGPPLALAYALCLPLMEQEACTYNCSGLDVTGKRHSQVWKEWAQSA